MSYKVVRDSLGVVIAFGPNDNNYEPTIKNGEVLTIEANAPEPSMDQQAKTVRSSRNQLLNSSDWTQISDSSADKVAWTIYRQALRDITTQSGFPWTITWPVEPQ
jgi:hypothetical protein